MTRLATLAVLAVLTLTGCQTPSSNGGTNGYEHPRASDYQSHTWMVGGGALILAGTVLLVATGRRADR